MKISEIFKTKSEGVAFEFFAPKTEKGEKAFFENLKKLEKISPDYVSVTYGAGGSSRDKTVEIVNRIAGENKHPVMAHLTSVAHTKSEIKELLDGYQKSGIENIMALRGDTPKGTNIDPSKGEIPHADVLIEMIKAEYNFCIGAAAFPELHPESPDREHYFKYFKQKVDAGAEFAVSQMFFVNERFFSMVDDSRKVGIDIPILPGIMPITSYKQIARFNELSSAEIPSNFLSKLNKVSDQPDEVYKYGLEFAVNQCQGLIDQGFDFLHFFTLNQSKATTEIYCALKGICF